MLRLIFVFGIILVGLYYSLQGAFYLLLLYLWNAYFRPEQWVWTDYISPLKLSLLVGVCLLAASLGHLRKFRINKQVALILLFLLQATISMLMSEHFEWSYFFWTEFAKVVIISVIMTFVIDDEWQYRLTLIVIAYSLGFEAVKQGWVQLLLNPGASNTNPHPVLGDNNGVALGMMMVVPIFVALAQTATSRWEKYIHRFFIVGAVYRGISTYSRGGFLAAGVLGLISFWRSPRKFGMLVSIAVLAVTITSVMPQRFWDRMSSITASEGQQDESSRGRLYFWQTAVRMADAKPMTGVGFNGFRQSFAAYDNSDGAWGGDRAVHSAWFGTLAEMGYPGLILFVMNLVVALFTCERLRRRAKSDPALAKYARYASALQTSFVVFVVGASFINGHYSEMYWHFVALSATLENIMSRVAVTEASSAAKTRPVPSSLRPAVAIPAFRVRKPSFER